MKKKKLKNLNIKRDGNILASMQGKIKMNTCSIKPKKGKGAKYNRGKFKASTKNFES